MEDKTILENRLLKNRKKLKKWLSQNHIEAYRLYDKDIPQYPYIIDIYKDSAIVCEKGKSLESTPENQIKIKRHHSDIVELLEKHFNIKKENIHSKKREKKKGAQQYESVKTSPRTLIVNENDCRYLVNLNEYLDSGLFLDHRPLRVKIKELSQGKSFLNLFCYTGAFSVAAAKGGANTCSVDMSKTYLAWARKNFELNKLDPKRHDFIHSDVFDWLKRENRQFDLIFCDPPSFSNSKRMQGSFDVQRDHCGLIRLCLQHLNPKGSLFFSTNLRNFKLDPALKEERQIKDVSLKTIPPDFSDLKIHQCFHIQQ